MALLLKNAHAIDPQIALDEICDILINDEGQIERVQQNIDIEGVEVRDLKEKIVTPGLVDIHVHLRDPGQEYKEDIVTGTRAAAHGGFTDICCMPNTTPVIDTGSVVEYINGKNRAKGKCRIQVAGACTKNLEGEILSEMGDMVSCGAVAFTDDGRGVQSSGMMRRVMDYATQFNKVIMSHCQDEELVDAGQVNEGVVSTKLGMLGWPAEGEEIQIERDIKLSMLTNCPLHIQHLTTAEGLDTVRKARERGAQVTCEVTPHHLFLCEDNLLEEEYNTLYKVNPPLRTKSDSEALLQGLVDGTVDCIVTDHAPHADFEKDREFELAPFGMTGLETSLALVITKLVKPGILEWNRVIELMSVNPREILRLAPVRISEGSSADLTIIDPDKEWVVTENEFESRANNSGFIGAHLTGRATDVYIAGKPTMLDGCVL